MSNNRTFFKKVQQGQLTLKDIFSDVFKPHTPEESARVLIGGTPLTTPRESEMLSNWQKPYMFFRFLAGCAVVVALALLLNWFGYLVGYDLILVILSFMAPVTMLLLTWELNVPRNISLTETLKLVAIGGILSLVFTACFNVIKDFLSVMTETSMESAVWAAVVEEPAKMAVVYFVVKKKDCKYALNGMLIGMAVGTGFAIMETLNYIMNFARYAMVISLAELMADMGLSASSLLAAFEEDFTYVQIFTQDAFLNGGYQTGLDVAITRALGSFSSHGTYAAIYGAGLVLAKGSARLESKHLTHPETVKYFVVAVVLHAANNSMIPSLLQVLFNGFEYAWALLEAGIMFGFFFLPLTRQCVNQVVEVSAAHNGGRVTMAVNRAAAPVQYGYAPAAPAAATFLLEGIAGPMVGRSFPIRGRVTLGRGAGCDISMPGASNVSGTHCVIQAVGGQVTVTDLGSTNGTYIAGRRLVPNQSVTVTSGTVIYLGNQSCGFAVR